MGILQRFKDIMASNINALLDKAEDPEKMIDQTLRNLTKDLAEVKKETAAVMADEQRCKRELDEVNYEDAGIRREGTSCRKRSRCHEVLRAEEPAYSEAGKLAADL